MTVTPDMAEVIADAIESALIDVHTGLPGAVQSYDPLTQTATIALQVKRTLPKDDGTYATEDLPVLENVPIEFPRSASFAVTFPLAPGDTGLVVFAEMSIDQWRSKGVNTSPGDIGRHTLTGGVFRPGLVPNIKALATAAHALNMVVGLDNNNAQIHITPTGSVLIGADAIKKAARKDDPVSVVIPALTVVTTPGTGGALNPAPITLNGQIDDGSATVKVSD
jgi:hypothetical protein